MSGRGTRRVIGAAMALGVLALARSGAAADLANIPGRWVVPHGQAVTTPWSRFIPVSVSAGPGIGLSARDSALRVVGRTPGSSYVRFDWFGLRWLPFRRVPVKVTPPVDVVPGGESIGVVVDTRGVVVTGYAPLITANGIADPAAEAGIRPGDVLLGANGQPLPGGAAGLGRVVTQAGETGHVLHLMDIGQSRRLVAVRPMWIASLHTWRIGVNVRSRASGVGTMTFWMPETHAYAALGHSITDGLTPTPAPLAGGRLLGAEVLGVVPSTVDSPGEKVGILTTRGGVAGTVTGNSQFGLTGLLSAWPSPGIRPVPVALPDQVHPGPAIIRTVVQGMRPQDFRIHIIEADHQSGPAIKGILFRITDARLIKLAGGVVQGMSGSPILQDGRLVGAVTHVLVNQPTLGYGCYAEWMVDTVPHA